MMDFKKLALGIIIIGALVAAYGVYEYLTAESTPMALGGSLGAPPVPQVDAHKARIQKAKLPIILIGGGIIVLGVVIKSSAKKEG
jgi:hypothetical protein